MNGVHSWAIVWRDDGRMEYKSLSFGLVDHIANDFSSEVNKYNSNNNNNNNNNIWYF